MTARENYFFEKLVESFNELVVNSKLVTIERDNLLEEKKNLQEELLME